MKTLVFSCCTLVFVVVFDVVPVEHIQQIGNLGIVIFTMVTACTFD